MEDTSRRGAGSTGGKESLLDPKFLLLAGLILACCLFGGQATGLKIPFFGLYFLASLSLAVSIAFGSMGCLNGVPRHILFLVIAVWAFPLLQLLPLPPALWSSLPGRELASAIRDSLGRGNDWQALSISPPDTWVSFFGITVFAVIFLLSLSLGARQVRLLLWILCGIAFFNIFVGSFQLISGGQYFDFYRSGHRANLIGFFANRNHTALYLSAMMPLMTYLIGTVRGAARTYDTWATIVGLLVLFTGVIGTSSRAGLAMGVTGLLTSMVMISATRFRVMRSVKGLSILVVATLAAGAPILLSERFANVLQRFDAVSSDLRWSIWKQSWIVAQTYLPTGAGMGTFRAAYDPLEPIAMVSPQYVNNAHNDYLELMIEGGYPVLVLLACLIAAVIIRAWKLAPKIWRNGLMSIYLPSIIFILLVLGHSWVDYPMRRLAIAGPFAFVLALLYRSGLTMDAKAELRPSR